MNTKPVTLTPEDASILIGALDTLGVALSGHSHRWSEGERAIYEEAQKLLGLEPDKFRKWEDEPDNADDWKGTE